MARQRKKASSSKLNNNLRIIGGKWRGRKFTFPSIPGLRPTSDRTRETLFNWLSPFIDGANCLDLFSGSGALGLEALSRGAGHVTMIDSSASVIGSIQRCLDGMSCTNATLLNMDALNWLKQPASQAPFNIVFMDPPFHQSLITPCCQLLDSSHYLSAGSIIYLESERSLPFLVPDSWQPHRNKIAGEVAYSLYIKEI